jgi:hypothetical protein
MHADSITTVLGHGDYQAFLDLRLGMAVNVAIMSKTRGQTHSVSVLTCVTVFSIALGS